MDEVESYKVQSYKVCNMDVILSDFYHKLEKIKRIDNCIKLKNEINQAKNPMVVAKTSGILHLIYFARKL